MTATPRPWLVRACLVLGLALAGVTTPAAASAPRCFGAASRDPEQACANPQLRHRLTPSPGDALLTPDAPCDPVGPSTELCRFGAEPAEASGTIALLGDSHARHWRASVLSVASAHDLFGWSLTRPSCPFTLADLALSEPDKTDCATFNRDVIRFVQEHPAIETVFVSEARAKVTGEDPGEQQVQGFIAAWNALPPTVKRIVVIRDPFYQPSTTNDCVEIAHRRGRDAGRACALRRATALKTDPAVVAARRGGQRSGLQVDAVDLTPFFCGARRCFPVVGGVLVHKDEAHITQRFARTLGPFLLRAYDRLAAAKA